MNSDILKLQNGSDIRGIALGDNKNLTEREAFLIGASYAIWLKKLYKKESKSLTVSIGNDPRLTAESLKNALSSGLNTKGVTVLDAGLCSTPAMFMSTIFEQYKCDGAIMITASHLPYDRNGFKFFSKNGGLDKKDIKEILENTTNIQYIKAPAKMNKIDLLDTYCEHLKGLVSMCKTRPLEGLHIIVDAGNGAGGFFANKVLKPLGADISGSQFLEPDGTFPNHAPNPEDENAMDSICRKVKEVSADLGLIFDTDVDRSSAVNRFGEEINRNSIVALASALGARENPMGTVVTDSVTSIELKCFLENTLGLNHIRYKRGYKNVINKGMELNNCFLAIETSGHAAYRENYFLDDGAYLAVKIVKEAAKLKKEGKGIDSLINKLKQPKESREYRIKIIANNYGEIGDKVIKNLKEFVDKSEDLFLEHPNYEGIRINFNGGWLLLRKSLHDPVMPLNIECNSIKNLNTAMSILKEFLSDYPELDISML